MPPRRKSKRKNGSRRKRVMFRVMPALEAYMTANIATQNLMGGNPFQVLLGDLNAQSGSGFLGQMMGPQPGVISIKELLTGSMNTMQLQAPGTGTSGTWPPTTTIGTSATSPVDAIAQNFQNNIGNIVVGQVMTTAGFRIANKVLGKPKRKMNKLLRDVGLGTTVQL